MKRRRDFICVQQQLIKQKIFIWVELWYYEFSYGEKIAIMPRNYPLQYRHGLKNIEHYAMIGMAHVVEDYPLYYDAVNEKGLGMAGLNFVGNACYQEVKEGAVNVAQYEFIPWVLVNVQRLKKLNNLFKQ